MRSEKTLQKLLTAACILVLLPLSVDQALRLEWSHYTVRLNYFAFAFTVLLLAVESARTPGLLKKVIGPLAESSFPFGLFLMGGAAVFGTFHSANPSRSALFTVWTLGTLAGLPLIARYVDLRKKPWPARLLSVYLTLQAIVITIDSFICHPETYPHLGRVVMVYDDHGCRPFAFYQEPNYYAAFALLTLVLLRDAWERESGGWRQWLGFSIAFGAASVFLSTSKMGILGIIALIVVEIVHQSIRAFTEKRRVRGAAYRPLAGKLTIAILACAGFTSAAIWANGSLRTSMLEALRIHRLSGTSGRLQNGLVVFDLLARHPWVGVGPGGTGAYLAEHLAELPRAQSYYRAVPEQRKDPEMLRHDPFFFNLGSELLGEWGVIGLFGFILILAALFRDLGSSTRWLAVVAFAVISASWQTLPRFDLWTCLSLLWAQQPRKRSA